MKGTGYQMRIPDILKNKWQKATCMASGKVSPDDAKLASNPVAVVPIFDPKVKGYIRSMLRTPIPTNGVMVDVKIELDWTRIVIPAPSIMATYPVRKLNFPGKSELTNFLRALAILPRSREFSSLTISTRQTQRMKRAMKSKMAPMAPSLQTPATFMNMKGPEKNVGIIILKRKV